MLVRVRRSLLVSVAAAALLVLGGCGGGGGKHAGTASTDAAGPGKASAPAAAGARSWTFAAEPYLGGPRVTQTSLARTAAVVKDRGVLLGQRVDARVAGDRIVVSCDGCSAPAVTATGRLAFYDWEANVRDERCRARPSDMDVTGGAGAGQPGAGSLGYYAAVVKAAKACRATDEADDTVPARWYGLDAGAHAVVCGPRPSAVALRAACQDAGKTPTRTVSVPRGILVLQAESDATDKAVQALAQDAYFLVEDDPALDGNDLADVRSDADDQTGQPAVVFAFTDAGRKKWRKVTRTIARRGAAAASPGQPATSFANHFAVVLDGRIISVPYIDPQQNPDGIDGEDGSQLSGTFTRDSARALAATLADGPLPLALRLVRRQP